MQRQPGPLRDPAIGHFHLDALGAPAVGPGIGADLDGVGAPRSSPKRGQTVGAGVNKIVQARLGPAEAGRLPAQFLSDPVSFASALITPSGLISPVANG